MDTDVQGLDAWIESVESRIRERSHGMTWIIVDDAGERFGASEFASSSEAWAHIDNLCNEGVYGAQYFRTIGNRKTHSVTGEHTMGRIMNHG